MYSKTTNPDGSTTYVAGPNADGTSTVLVVDAAGAYQPVTGTPGELWRVWVSVNAQCGADESRLRRPNGRRTRGEPYDSAVFPVGAFALQSPFQMATTVLAKIRSGG